MIVNSNKIQGTIHTELCIIGAGVAGITIAKSLANSKIDITILESGNLEYDDKIQSLYEGVATGEHYNLRTSRLRFLGGSSNHWNGMCCQLDPMDFTKKDWVPYSGWPITHTDLDEHYLAAKKILGVEKYKPTDVPIIKSEESLLKTNRWILARKLRFNKVYRKTLASADNIKLVTNATVTNIQINDHASGVDYLEVRGINEESFKVKAKTYILATGGMENARILLYSNNVMASGIGNQHDVVGRFFMDHPQFDCGDLFSFNRPEKLNFISKSLKIHILNKTLENGNPLYCLSPTEKAQMQYKMLNSSISVKVSRAPQATKDPIFSYMLELSDSIKPNIHEASLFARTEQSPNPDSRLTLLWDKRDKLNLPMLTLNWNFLDIDRYTLVKMLHIVSKNAPPEEAIVRINSKMMSGKGIPKNPGYSYHHMGTTRMGDDPKTSVVDKNCRVHGMENLFIAGSSVFATSGWANPTLTIVALALRLKEHLYKK